MYIVLLGPPGSGKGTQAGFLSKRYNIGHMSTGDLFRDILNNPAHPLYEQVEVINEGKLVCDEVVNKVVEDGITKPQFERGVVFDGYPRTTAQAGTLADILSSIGEKLDLVLDLNVTEEVLLYRLLGRRVCPSCKKVFHSNQGIEICPDCDVELIKRADDNEETINRRLIEYNNKTSSLREYYKNNAPYLNVKIDDKTKTPQEVMVEIHDQLKGYNLK